MCFRGGELEGGVWGGAIVAVCVCVRRGEALCMGGGGLMA